MQGIDIILTCQIVEYTIPRLTNGSRLNRFYQVNRSIIQAKTKFFRRKTLAHLPGLGKRNGYLDRPAHAIFQAQRLKSIVIEHLDALQMRTVNKPSPHAIPNWVMGRLI